MKFREKSTNKFYAFALAAVFALALAGCGGGGGGGTTDTTEPPAPMPDPAIAQRAAIDTAIDAASAAVNAVANDSTDAQVSAADMAIANARSAIMAAANVPAEERAANTGTVDALATQLDGAKTARMDAMDAADMDDKMAMMATAMKLHAGISASGGTGDATRIAAYATNDIAVTIGSASAVNLSQDKDAMAATHYGWQGMRFTAEPDGAEGTYEAMVYSNVGEPTEGAKFEDTHTLNADSGETGDVSSLTGHVAARVASSSFDHSAGLKEFELPDNAVRVMIAGSYQGVSGMYYCQPTSATTTCSATVSGDGFTLGGGTWTFKPTNPETRLMSIPDAVYASYGWWIHKSEDGSTFTASAFAANKGSVNTVTGLDVLNGTATYMGGAAGKYALRSMTGGTNDAGHFTAKATLEANFTDNTITGTIDNFMGADGEARDWSVELKEAAVSGTGEISRTADDDTVWSMGGTAASASGEWSGNFYENGDDLVPKVGTGTFYTEFGADGKMVGAFGVNKQ